MLHIAVDLTEVSSLTELEEGNKISYFYYYLLQDLLFLDLFVSENRIYSSEFNRSFISNRTWAW